MEKIDTLIEAFEKSSNLDSGINFIYSKTDEEFIKYRELYHTSLCVLNGMKNKGIKKGDELIFQISNNKDFITIFWACILGGIIAVPVTTGSGKEDAIKLVNVWKKMKSPSLIVSDDNLSNVKELLKKIDDDVCNKDIASNLFVVSDFNCDEEAEPEKVDKNEIAYIQFSSGSTGNPKGVILTHNNLMTNIVDILNGSKAGMKDISLTWMPLTHDMGLIGFHICPLVLGVNQYNMSPSMFIRYPLLMLDKVSEHKATMIASPNFGYSYILSKVDKNKEYTWDLSSVRVIFNGAEMISYETCQSFLDAMEKYNLRRESMFSVYGMAEASLAICFPEVLSGMQKVVVDRSSMNIGEKILEKDIKDANDVILVEEGTPVESCSLKITDDNNNVVPDRVIGHIKIKGDNVTSGYYNEKKKSSEIFSEDGWLNTGDLGFLRDGNIVVVGRMKDVIILNGKNYYAADLERIVKNVTQNIFKDVAVVGINEVKEKEYIVVFVTFSEDTDKLEDYIEKIRLALYQECGLLVDEIIPIDSMPKTTSGKIQHFKLVEQYKLGVYNDVINELKSIRDKRFNSRTIQKAASEIEIKIVDIFKKVLNVEEIGINDELYNFAITSLQITEIYDGINSLFPNKFTVSDLYRYKNIKEISECISNENKVYIVGNKYPDEFFINTEGDFKKLNSTEYSINSNVLDKLLVISAHFNTNIYDAITSILIYLCWQLSNESTVNISTMFEDDKYIRNININVDEIDDIGDLFNLVREHKGNNKVEDVINTCKGSVISSLIYNYNLLDNLQSVKENFDMFWGIISQDKNILLYITYDSAKIKISAVNKLLYLFEKIVDKLNF